MICSRQSGESFVGVGRQQQLGVHDTVAEEPSEEEDDSDAARDERERKEEELWKAMASKVETVREEERDKAREKEAADAARRAAAEEAHRVQMPEAGASAASVPDIKWAVGAADKAKYDGIFAQMQPEDGLVGGAKVAPVLKKSGLTQDVLRDIWTLVDVAKDGVLDADWFAVAMHLAMRAKRGHPLPEALPMELVPPKDR